MPELRELIEVELPRLRRYSRFLSGNSGQADSLVHSSLVRARASLHLWQVGTNIRVWLFALLRSEFARGRWRDGSIVEASGTLFASDKGPDSAPSAIGSDEVGTGKAFALLPPEYREVLMLVAVEGFSYDEAATILDLPIGTVRSRLSAARVLLGSGNSSAPESRDEG